MKATIWCFTKAKKQIPREERAKIRKKLYLWRLEKNWLKNDNKTDCNDCLHDDADVAHASR